jgi:hypothetical protein
MPLIVPLNPKEVSWNLIQARPSLHQELETSMAAVSRIKNAAAAARVRGSCPYFYHLYECVASHTGWGGKKHATGIGL